MSSSSTLRALKPYLLVYRIVGLLQYQFHIKRGRLETIIACQRWSKWNVQSLILALLVSVFFVDRTVRVSLTGRSADTVSLFGDINGFIFAVNVLFTTMMCSIYLSKRLCRLVDRMICFEKQLEAYGCQLQVSFCIPIC